MPRWTMAALLIFLMAGSCPGEVKGAQLKNLESQLLCVYWKLSDLKPGDSGLTDLLPLGPDFQRLGPGETSRLDLADDEGLVMVFVPWTQSLQVRSPVRGVVVRSAELFSGKQFPLSFDGLWAAHPNSRLEAALSDWGLNVPRFALDGNGTDWEQVPVTARWSPTGARPGQPLSLKIRLADQALWLFAQQTPGPSDDNTSWVLRGKGGFWELFPGGTNSRVWQFLADGSAGKAVGWRVVAENRLEAWIPLERLSTDLLAVGQWQLRLVSSTENPDNSLLLDVTMGDLP